MNKILFVCHGNVGRSPMAEFVFKHMVSDRGLENEFEIASAGTSKGAAGIPFCIESREKLAEKGVPFKERAAIPIAKEDYQYYDMIICMDIRNFRDLYAIMDDDPQEKISLLLDFTDRKGEEIADPWYTDDYETAWRDIDEGCRGLLETLVGGA